MLAFPLTELMNEQACYDWLCAQLYPEGLRCPNGHHLPAGQAPHDRLRAPIFDWRCRQCGAVFNIFTGTIFSKTRYSCAIIIQIMKGISQGVPTAHLARELEIDRSNLLEKRHLIQALLEQYLSPRKLSDDVVESDELYQNAGEKGMPHLDPEDPPRRRANKALGHGTWDNDRPPIIGIVGRETGEIRLEVCRRSTRAELEPIVLEFTKPNTTINTDEWGAYKHLSEANRNHSTVCHAAREWARDDDGDGIREVHCNTMEGIWTGVRNFLRSFRGVSKWYLSTYLAVFEWAYNLKTICSNFIKAMCMLHI